MQYFGADALGSVRQIYNSSGQIIANKRYDPYGNVLAQNGVGTSNYGYTGEWTDATGLEYLRARYYAPTQGRFTTRDVWEGDPNAPMSYNAWLYVYANPTNKTDPSGRCSEPYDPYDPCWQLYDRATKTYGVWPWPDNLHNWDANDLSDLVVWLGRGIRFQVDPGKEWTSVNLNRVLMGLGLVNNYLENKTQSGLGLTRGTLTMRKSEQQHCGINAAGCAGTAEGIVYLNLGSGSIEDRDTTIHELGHFVDFNAGSAYPYHVWSWNAREWLDAGAWYNIFGGYHILWNCKVGFKGFTGAVSKYAMSNPQEDFAETFMWVVLKKNGQAPTHSDNPWNTLGEPNQERLDALKMAIDGLP